MFINRDQYFEGVTPETWEFTIGGYRPAEKWLKDRRRRTLTYEDIAHYRRICAAFGRDSPDYGPHRPSNRVTRRLAAELVGISAIHVVLRLTSKTDPVSLGS